jgi:hypothetical protein
MYSRRCFGGYRKKRVKGRGEVISLVASAFSCFSYRQLLNLDVRDLMFWGKEAEKRNIKGQLDMIYAVRIGMADENGFSTNVYMLENKLKELEIGKEEMVKRNWEELKERRGR